MIRKLLFFLAVGLCAVPASMASGGSNTSAQSQCAKLRASIGATAFTAAYSTFGGCVSKLAPVDQGNQSTARASCTAQQADTNFAASHNGKTFDQYYGTGAKGKNAFGNCVSASVRASVAAEVSATPNPARTCAAARTAMGTDAFKRLYGTNANKSNAFGKCVSKTARAQTTNEVNAAVTCRTDAAVTSPTAAPNAFGKCVASTTQASSTSQQQATVNAAHACEAELTASLSTFKSTYKTFGACVSAKAKAA
jgi:hypothetical protein